MNDKISYDQASQIKSLDTFIEYYNCYPFSWLLFGQTPMEIVNGEAINKQLYTICIKKLKLKQPKLTETLINLCLN